MNRRRFKKTCNKTQVSTLENDLKQLKHDYKSYNFNRKVNRIYKISIRIAEKVLEKRYKNGDRYYKKILGLKKY